MPYKPSRKTIAGKHSAPWLLAGGLAIALASVWGIARWMVRSGIKEQVYPAIIHADLRKVSGTPPDEVRNCAACHATEVTEWTDSHHANANRLFQPFYPQSNVRAFGHGGTFSANGSKTIIQNGKEIGSVAVVGPGGARAVYRPEAVIGVAPLVQYLFPFPGGRLQTLNISFDPRKEEWFDMEAPEPSSAGRLVALAESRHELEFPMRFLSYDESAQGIRRGVG